MKQHLIWRLRRSALIFISPVVFVLLTLMPFVGHAQEETITRALEDDNWFFYIGSGIGRSWYGESIQDRIDEQKAQGGSSPNVGTFDLPGIYRRWQPGLSAGILLTANFEHVARKWQDKNSLAIQTYNPSLSLFYFLSRRTGLGWFVRGDLGYSRIVLIREQGDDFHRTIDSGVFAQGAAGYAWRAGSVARMLMHLSAYRVQGADHQAGGLFYNVGFLF